MAGRRYQKHSVEFKAEAIRQTRAAGEPLAAMARPLQLYALVGHRPILSARGQPRQAQQGP